MSAGIEEFDLEGSVYDWAFLPDELIVLIPDSPFRVDQILGGQY